MTSFRFSDEELQEYFDSLSLRYGSGSGGNDVCVMQAVDYITTGGNSDHPKCASHVIANFMIGLNDRLGDERRQMLKRFIPRLADTRGTGEQEQQRRYILRDWAVRRLAPTWFEVAGFPQAAQKLRDLPEILDEESRARGVAVLRALRGEHLPCGRNSYWAWRSGLYSAVYKEVRVSLEKKKTVISTADAAAAVAADAAAAAVAADAAAAAAVAADDAADAADAATADAAVAVAAVAAADAAADAADAATADAAVAWRNALRDRVRAAVLDRLESAWGSALDRNMTIVVELIERLIAVSKGGVS